MISLEDLFCSVDDFCQSFEPQWKQQLLGSGLKHRNRPRSLSLSEIMTISIAFHQSCYRNFKTYYPEKVQVDWAAAFPGLVSYQRFIEWGPGTLVPMCAYLRSCFGKCSGISFMDSTCIKVCHNRQIKQHKVFEDLAATGQNLGRLVLWLQTASRGQRPWRTAQHHPDSGQHRSRSACAKHLDLPLCQNCCSSCWAQCLRTKAMSRKSWQNNCSRPQASNSSPSSSAT